MALAESLEKVYKLPQGTLRGTGSGLDYVPTLKDRVVDNLPLVPENIERMMMSDQYKDFDTAKKRFIDR